MPGNWLKIGECEGKLWSFGLRECLLCCCGLVSPFLWDFCAYWVISSILQWLLAAQCVVSEYSFEWQKELGEIVGDFHSARKVITLCILLSRFFADCILCCLSLDSIVGFSVFPARSVRILSWWEYYHIASFVDLSDMHWPMFNEIVILVPVAASAHRWFSCSGL